MGWGTIREKQMRSEKRWNKKRTYYIEISSGAITQSAIDPHGILKLKRRMKK